MKAAIDTGKLTLFIQGGTGGIGGGLVCYALKEYKWKKVFISYRETSRLEELKKCVANSQNAYEYINLDLDYRYNDPTTKVLERGRYIENRYYYRSDHYNFAKNNVPVIFYFNGTHADYHAPTDTVEKIEYELLEKRTRLIFHTAWEIVNREGRLRLKE